MQPPGASVGAARELIVRVFCRAVLPTLVRGPNEPWRHTGHRLMSARATGRAQPLHRGALLADLAAGAAPAAIDLGDVHSALEAPQDRAVVVTAAQRRPAAPARRP